MNFVELNLSHFAMRTSSSRRVSANFCYEPASPIGLTTLGSTVLRKLTRNFHQDLSLSCVAEDSLSGEELQICLDRGCPRLQLASSSRAPRARRFGPKYVLDHFTVWTSCNITKPAARRRRSAVGAQSLRFTCRTRWKLSLSKTSSLVSSTTRVGHALQPWSRIDRTTA